jgi:hypothetical protein
MHLEMSRTFPVPRKDGFAYIINPETWEEWSPIEVAQPEEVQFGKVGDLVAFTYRPLAFPIHGQVTLEAIEPGDMAKLLFAQRGFTDVTMRWEFANAGAHAFTLHVVMDWEDEGWWQKTVHYLSLMPPAIRRDVTKAFDRLQEHFLAVHAPAKKAS